MAKGKHRGCKWRHKDGRIVAVLTHVPGFLLHCSRCGREYSFIDPG